MLRPKYTYETLKVGPARGNSWKRGCVNGQSGRVGEWSAENCIGEYVAKGEGNGL